MALQRTTPPPRPGTTPGASPTAVVRSAPLSPQETFQQIRAKRAQKPKKINLLLVGPHGTGKTFNMIHAPGPVLIHSFDPGGTNCIPNEEFETGRVIADTSFEGDRATNPFAFRAWEKEFRRLHAGGIFEHIGTYVVDSFTQFTHSLMYEILKGRGRQPRAGAADLGKDPDIVPELGDYNLQQKVTTQYLAEITSLPCNTVVIGHINTEKDDLTGRIFSAIMMDGKKYPQMVPTLFDEVYLALAKPAGPGKMNYRYKLVPDTLFQARSRLRKVNVLDSEEDANLKAILEKAGYPHEDKPLFTTQES